jgi:hypothetical protein
MDENLGACAVAITPPRVLCASPRIHDSHLGSEERQHRAGLEEYRQRHYLKQLTGNGLRPNPSASRPRRGHSNQHVYA